MEQQLQTVYTIEHKGIVVGIKINYAQKTIGIIEYTNKDNWNLKGYIFGNRGLEYVEGWLDIIEALGVAIENARKKLQEYNMNTNNFDLCGNKINGEQEFSRLK